MKNSKCIKTTHWETNSYQLGQVREQDLYEEDWLEKPPTLMQERPVVEEAHQLCNLGNLSDLD